MLSALFPDRKKKKKMYPLEITVVVFFPKIQARDCHVFTYALVLIHVTSVRRAFQLPFALHMFFL